MIRNQWYVVLESKEVKKGKTLGVTRLGERMVFFRNAEGKVVCLGDQCPHLGASLCQGKVLNDQIQCPFHGFEFDPTGKCTYIPALGRNGDIPKAIRAKSYKTYEAYDWIWIWWGDSEPDPVEPNWFDIDNTFSYSTYHELWPTHYSRSAENQLDVMHLPFVHRTTIGAGGRTVVDGPQVKIEDNVLYLWVHNRLDDGSPAQKAEELPPPTRKPFLVFNFPNLWENRISDQLRILAAFVPVDDEHTMFYIRYYQNFLRFPILKEISNWIGMIGSIYILHQDKRVVLEQRPKQTTLKKMGEKLTQGDHAILAYRTHRYNLQKAAGQIQEE